MKTASTVSCVAGMAAPTINGHTYGRVENVILNTLSRMAQQGDWEVAEYVVELLEEEQSLQYYLVLVTLGVRVRMKRSLSLTDC